MSKTDELLHQARQLDLDVLENREEFLEITCSWNGDCENTSQK